MPELIEVELYRRALDPLIGGRVEAVDLCNRQYLRPRGADPELINNLVRSELVGTDRIGKLLLVDLAEPEQTIGLRFGMTGRLLVDGVGPLDRLEYASNRDEPAWDRVRFLISGRTVAVRDPRRLGSVELLPDTSRLGPDATTISGDQLAERIARRMAPIKALLLDQGLVAGLGNLLTDEILWTASVDPTRPGNELTDEDVVRLHEAMTAVIEVQTARGGSHTGDLFPERGPGGICPADGEPLRRDTVGARTTWWCPAHQR